MNLKVSGFSLQVSFVRHGLVDPHKWFDLLVKHFGAFQKHLGCSHVLVSLFGVLTGHAVQTIIVLRGAAQSVAQHH